MVITIYKHGPCSNNHPYLRSGLSLLNIMVYHSRSSLNPQRSCQVSSPYLTSLPLSVLLVVTTQCPRLRECKAPSGTSLSIHAMRSTCDMPPNRWDEFIVTVCYLTNRTPIKSQNSHTPYECWYSTKPDLSHLHEIGCQAFVLIQNFHNSKVFDWSIECVLIGYSQDSKAYHLFHRPSKKILVSYHVSFFESHQDSNPPRPHATPSSPPTTANPLTIPSVPPPPPMPEPRHSPHTPIPSEKLCAAQGIPYIPASCHSPHTVTITTVPDDDNPPPTSTFTIMRMTPTTQLHLPMPPPYLAPSFPYQRHLPTYTFQTTQRPMPK